MGSVVFETVGNLDLRSVTIFGCNSKPKTKSPIGYFGTGLKYALAILAREGCGVTIYRGLDEPLKLTTGESNFRDTTLNTIKLGNQELPFTTELGKNWKLWQAFRELESNTRDERGSSYILYDIAVEPEEGRTFIEVTGEAFMDVYEDRSSVFLDTDAEEIATAEPDIEVYNEESKYLYYNGIRVYEFKNPSCYTYNILSKLDLTEDRTLAYWFMAEAKIARAIGTMQARTRIVEVLEAADCMEASINYNYNSVVPNQTFVQAVLGASPYNTSAKALVESLEEPDEEEEAESLETKLANLIHDTIGKQVSDDNDLCAKIQEFIDEHYYSRG